MIAVTDINAIWRIKPFEALAQLLPVTGLSPRRWFGADPEVLGSASRSLAVLPVSLPPGWASRGENFSARLLLRRLRSLKADSLFVTTPHYLPLARRAAREMAVYYYCSDDYAEYAGWGGQAVEESERELITHCKACFFVSSTLAGKAVRVLGADPSKVHVSPNATDLSVGSEAPPALEGDGEEILGRLVRPVVGVVGALNDRIDFELLLECARLKEVGTLLLVGPSASQIDSASWGALKAHPKCVITGARPHREIAAWMREIDVALIPYADTKLNRACSPMRLFDHLVSGKPIVATSACDQVSDYDTFLSRGADRAGVLDLVRKQCPDPVAVARSPEFLQGLTWNERAKFIASHL